DVAAEALSPVPQAPRTRLLSPTEGTGYLKMLEDWARDKAVAGSPDSGESIMMTPRVPDLRPEPRVPNDPETERQTREENRAFRGENSGYPTTPGRTSPNEIGPNPSVPRTPQPATPTPPAPGAPGSSAFPGSNTPRVPMSRNAQPFILNSVSREKVGTSAEELSPKEVDLHPGYSPARVAQSGQRAPLAASPGEVLSASDEKKPVDAVSSKFFKPGSKPVQLDTVKPETRTMMSQFAASEKTGIPLPNSPSAQPSLIDAAVVQTQATAPAAAPGDTGPKPVDPAKLPEPLDIVKPDSPAARPPGQPGGMAVEDTTTKLLELLNPNIQGLDIQLAAGLPRGSKVYVITPDQALTLALVNSRDYQSRLENIYTTAIPVTLQRFNLEPQVFAGLSPTTGTAAGGSPANFANSFLYRTLEAPGGQSSVLSQGQVAGVGKVFSSGARVVAAFASQTVFNLTGSNPIQPNVQSVIPISIVQPFLKGGGRAVTLEGLTQAERNLLYEVRAFARYRQGFVAKTMLGNASGGSTNLSIGNTGATGVGGDPTIGFMPLLQTLMQIENNRNAVSSYETALGLQEEQLGGEGSTLTQLQVDQTNNALQNSRVALLTSQVLFRNQLDQFKMQMGLPPDTPIMPELELISPYRKFLRDLRGWSIRKERELAEVDEIVGRLPDLDELDIRIDDRSVLDVIINEKFDEEEDLLNS
ncbi:MAG: hypothetical protein ACKO0V_08010, partial [bacterium]